MEVEFWATTHTGLARDHNEDNFLVDRDLSLFMVCDGMGGHAAGEVASALSVRVIHQMLQEHQWVLDDYTQDMTSEAARQAVLELLHQAISEANRQVFALGQLDPEREGMGTTCCALLLLGGRGFVGHVGDSRIYRIREQQVDQITDDHSLLNEMIRQGRAREGDQIPNQNAVTRAVGVRESVEVDVYEVDVQTQDLFVLCSDGFSEYIERGAQLVGMIDPADLEASSQRCIEHALEGGGKDNITTILLRVRELDAAKKVLMYSPTAKLLRASPLFSEATPSEIARLCEVVDRHAFEPGDMIIEPNRSADCICLIVSGSVGVSGTEVGVTALHAGDTFGELSLLGRAHPREGYEALAPTRLLVFRREPLFELLRESPNLAGRVFFGLASNMADQLHRVPADLRYDPQLWDEINIVGDHTPLPSTVIVQEQAMLTQQDRPSPPSLDEPSGPPPLKQTQGNKGPKTPKKTMRLSPVGRRGGAKKERTSTPASPKKRQPPRPPVPYEGDDDDTQKSVVVDDLRKTAEFDRTGEKFDKI